MMLLSDELSVVQLNQVANIYVAEEEGKLPEEELTLYLETENLKTDEIGYFLAKYSIYRGVEIANKDNFFQQFATSSETGHPGIYFWRAFDALIRGRIERFKALWTIYTTFNAESFNTPFLYDAYLVPENPVFVHVQDFIQKYQHKISTLLEKNNMQNHKDKNESNNDHTYFQQITEWLGNYGNLLSFFRIQQTQFQRYLNFEDLRNAENLIKDKSMIDIGPYWELYVLITLTQWRLNFSLIYQAIESLVIIKHLNSIATNPLFEISIFQLEARIAFAQNREREALELLSSADYLSNYHEDIISQINTWEIRSQIDPESALSSLNNWLSLSQIYNLDLLQGKALQLIINYQINKKDITKAKEFCEKAIKLLKDSNDLLGYNEVIANYSYLLIIQQQFKIVLEYTQILIQSNNPLIIRIRGRYLQGVALMLLDNFEGATESIEEGIRIAIHSTQNIQLPWFYELLAVMYLSQNNWSTAANYFLLASKVYFKLDLPLMQEKGLRANLAYACVLTILKDFGRAFSQIQNLLTNNLNAPLLQEILWVNSTIIWLSDEQDQLSQDSWNKLWSDLSSELKYPIQDEMYWNRVNNNMGDSQVKSINKLCLKIKNAQKQSKIIRELILWLGHTYILKMDQIQLVNDMLNCISSAFLPSILSYQIENSVRSVLRSVQNQKFLLKEIEPKLKSLQNLLPVYALVLCIRRIISQNLPLTEISLV